MPAPMLYALVLASVKQEPPFRSVLSSSLLPPRPRASTKRLHKGSVLSLPKGHDDLLVPLPAVFGPLRLPPNKEVHRSGRAVESTCDWFCG